MSEPIKICMMSDFDFRSSGYFGISTSLAKGMAERGYEIKAVGFGYRGEEHNFPMSIIPCRDFRDSIAIIQNLAAVWPFHILLVIMDIPVHEQYLSMIQDKGNVKYVGITPIEADPLCLSWALVLTQMDKALIISEFGLKEAQKMGVNAEYLPVGIDLSIWRRPTPEEKAQFRAALGLADDEFVFLTVAFNQERKFLSRGLEMFADFVYNKPNVETLLASGERLKPERKAKYILVTSEHSAVGWRLRDLASELGISDRLVIIERGIPVEKLWSVYAASDAFLLTSKAEGLGMILMEAMAVGIPCIGTSCTGISELLADGRGKLIPVDYVIRDPFGNGRRYYPSRSAGVELMNEVAFGDNSAMVEAALKYISGRTWDKAVDVLCRVVKSVMEGE